MATVILFHSDYGLRSLDYEAVERLQAAGILFLHSIAQIAGNARKGLPSQLHLADPDPYEPAEDVAAWRSAAAQSWISADIFTYPGCGHIFTDAGLPDYDAKATDLTWSRVLSFLDTIEA